MEFNIKNYDVCSLRLEKYPNEKFYMVFKRVILGKKITRFLSR